MENYKVFVKYDPETMLVEGFYIEEEMEIEEEGSFVEIDKNTETQILNNPEFCDGKSLFVKDVESKEFEYKVIKLENIPKTKEEEEIDRLTDEVSYLRSQLEEVSSFMATLREMHASTLESK